MAEPRRATAWSSTRLRGPPPAGSRPGRPGPTGRRAAEFAAGHLLAADPEAGVVLQALELVPVIETADAVLKVRVVRILAGVLDRLGLLLTEEIPGRRAHGQWARRWGGTGYGGKPSVRRQRHRQEQRADHNALHRPWTWPRGVSPGPRGRKGRELVARRTGGLSPGVAWWTPPRSVNSSISLFGP